MRPFPAISIIPEYLFWPLFALMVGWWLVMRLRKAAGIWKLRYFALPRHWLMRIHEHVPYYKLLPLELRAPYQDKVLNFVDGKFYRPCGSCDEITEPDRIIIAGFASLLLLNSSAEVIYPGLLAVQVYYPQAEDPFAKPNCIAILWDDVKKHALDPLNRGKGEALAAIAAELGMKALPQPLLLSVWARARLREFSAAFPLALENVAAGEESDIFAVATEVFYAAPATLRQSKPALYDAMRQFYKIDPARWPSHK